MAKIALFPGSFDPITIGHHDIITRSAPLFDKLVIGVGVNSSKKPFFTLEERIEMINSLFADNDNIEVVPYEGLTVNFCKSIGANYIVRGVRSGNDFEFEQAIAQMNRSMNPKLETLAMFCQPAYSAISSTIVREIIKHGGDVSQFVPPSIAKIIKG